MDVRELTSTVKTRTKKTSRTRKVSLVEEIGAEETLIVGDLLEGIRGRKGPTQPTRGIY